MRTLALTLILALAACGGGEDDTAQKAKLASDLVTCKNDLSNLKEQLNDAKAALAKAEQAAGQVIKLDPVAVKGEAQSSVHHRDATVTPAAVMKVIQMNGSGLRACYNHALKRKPDLQYVSKVTSRFQLHNNGQASDVSFAPHTDSEMERCMAQTMEKWKFPSFQGDAVAIEQPVNLVVK